MFYGFAMISAYFFLYIATKWKDIMEFWYMKERPFLYKPYTMEGLSLSLKVRLIGLVFFIFYLIEHIMFIGMELNDNDYQLTYCNVTDFQFLNNYMRRERPHLLDVLPYRWWIFPPFQWTITLMAFDWNFVDYFVIILSLGLSTRFNQLNRRLRKVEYHQMDRKFCEEIRIHYTNLVDLLKFIDGTFATPILLSMSHNSFLICTKVFEAIK
jgi:gustatory receptor